MAAAKAGGRFDLGVFRAVSGCRSSSRAASSRSPPPGYLGRLK
ncbi:MAG TPA: hypothetical protein VGV38_11870 [Pyrinomonadaceae bacterium]|nr:hypothetical protein [Pyrinomonadaceae bacterium]